MSRSYLRLVRDRKRNDEPETHRFIEVQESLLPITDRTLGICTADSLDEPLLTTMIEKLRPSLILDFRTTPRFDFGSFNRRKAFQLFDLIGSRYRDLGNAAANPSPASAPVTDALTQALQEVELKANISSVLVFVDVDADYETIGLTGVNSLRRESASPWELLLFGPTEIKDETRNILFISHANPEDNDFVLWLQTQLTRLGYETWSDLTELKAGEIFWDTIESVIRTKAVRVLAVSSRSAMQKPAVLDEISLAISIERSRQLNGFVIPIRVDDLPFSEFRANLARKNIVDFSAGWALGLSRLTDSLAKDKISKSRQDNQVSLASWWARRKPALLSISNATETLVSNRFRLKSLPIRVYSYIGDPTNASAYLNGLVPFGKLWLSFLSAAELDRNGLTGLSKQSVISASEFFAGNAPISTDSTKRGNPRLLNRMLNNQWEAFLITRGLRLYHETGARPTPYIPDGLLPKNTAYFHDVQGFQRRRLLVGSSAKRKVFWHLAPLGFFSVHAEATLTIKMRVLFSEDGQEKWPTGDRIRTMRRSFCKNWWNDRWRSLQATLMAWLSEDHDEIVVHSGDGGTLSVESKPICYLSPVSINETHAKTREDQRGDTIADDADDESAVLHDLDAFEGERGLSQGTADN